MISDLSPVSFTASWDALADAQGYKLYLMRNFYDGETITTSYDFTNEITGMPEGWLSSTNLLGTMMVSTVWQVRHCDSPRRTSISS